MTVVKCIAPDPVFCTHIPQVEQQFDQMAVYRKLREMCKSDYKLNVIVASEVKPTPFASDLILSNVRANDACKDLQVRTLKSRERKD